MHRKLTLETFESRRVMAFDLTVMDVNKESNALETVREPVALGATAFFYGRDPQNGLALWKSNGTSASTVMVKDLDMQLYPSALSMARVGNVLYFTAAASATDLGLWKTDGTSAGTTLVKNLGGQSQLVAPKNMTAAGNKLYFNSLGQLWESNGTSSGTVMAYDSEPLEMENVGGALYFTTMTEPALGSPEPQMLIKGSGPATLIFDSNGRYDDIDSLTNVGGTLYFTVFDKILKELRLVRFEGTSAFDVGLLATSGPLGPFDFNVETEVVNGTMFLHLGSSLKKIGASGPLETVRDDIDFISGLTNVSGNLYFTASTPANGSELWKSNGTAIGTTMVRDIDVGAASSKLTNLTNVGGILYFSKVDGDADTLWRSNGTFSGTTQVATLDYEISDMPFVNVGGMLYFSLDVDYDTSLLWRSTGTEAGTVQVKEVQTASSNASQLTTVGDKLFFTALEADFATELWVTDGSQSGLRKLNINFQAGSEPSYLTNVNGTLYFTATHPVTGTELWKSDGTTAGTTIVSDLRRGSNSSFPRQLTNVNGTLYFTAESTSSGRELWRLNRGSPVLVRDIRSGVASSNIANMMNVGNRLYFTANDGTNGVELWSSNGSASGTTMVRNIAPGAASSNPQSLTAVESTLYFTANDATNGVELWKSTGTSATTVMVRNIATGSASSSPSNLTNVSGTLFFSANDGFNGNELFRSNGTSLSTERISDIALGQFSSNPGELTNVWGTLYFSATNSSGDRELWRRTASGVSLASNINPSGSSNPNNLRHVNGLLYFAANDGRTGNELWRFDGSIAQRMVNHVVGSGNGNPANIVAFGQRLAFASTSNLYGREVFIYDPLKGSVDDDYFRLAAGQLSGVNMVSVFRGPISGPEILVGRFATGTQIQLDGREGSDEVNLVGIDLLVNQAGIHLQGVVVNAINIETRQLTPQTNLAPVRFDADSPLGDFVVWTTDNFNTNVLDFSASSLPIQLDLQVASLQTVNENLRLEIPRASSLSGVIGGSASDIIFGNDIANTMSGGGGNDLLVGRGGHDSLSGDSGDDQLDGSAGDDQLIGGPGNDNYVFADTSLAEADVVVELPGEGTDRIDFQAVTTSVTFNLGLVTAQPAQANRTIRLSAGDVVEALRGGLADDLLIGNALNNILEGYQGNDNLRGEAGDDVYYFDVASGASELDTVTELAGAGRDTLDFSALAIDVSVDLALISNQLVHTNRTLKLSSGTTFENALGGLGNDTLLGNGLANVLVGNAGNDTLRGRGKRDLLIGGNGLDILFGGDDEDIMIPSRTNHDQILQNLNDLCLEWSSAATYAQRILSLKSGVGSGGTALNPLLDVLDDNGALDQLSGEAALDWFFKDAADAILDLNGEVVEEL